MLNAECNAMLSPGLSIEGFEAFCKAKYKPKKLTRQEWLKQFKDCAHCKRDGKCKAQSFGYHQQKGIVHDGNGQKTVVAHGVHINKQLAPKSGSYRDCCIWNLDTMDLLCGELESLVQKGEVI